MSDGALGPVVGTPPTLEWLAVERLRVRLPLVLFQSPHKRVNSGRVELLALPLAQLSHGFLD